MQEVKKRVEGWFCCDQDETQWLWIGKESPVRQRDVWDNSLKYEESDRWVRLSEGIDDDEFSFTSRDADCVPKSPLKWEDEPVQGYIEVVFHLNTPTSSKINNEDNSELFY